MELLKEKSGRFKKGRTDWIKVLFYACENGYVDEVKKALEHKANIEATDDYFDWSPLMRAAANGKSEVVKFLIKKGAKVNKVREGKTALTWASKYGFYDVVEHLLKKGAKLQPRGCNRDPIKEARGKRLRGYKKVVKLLLKYKKKK